MAYSSEQEWTYAPAAELTKNRDPKRWGLIMRASCQEEEAA